MINKPCDFNHNHCHPPIPNNYPFNGAFSHDTYSYCVCGEMQPPPPPSPYMHKPHPAPPSPKFPAFGPFIGSAFTAHDMMPYLIDTTHTSYGQVLCYSENVYTKITQRNDPSCINLSATFNFTDTTMANAIRFDFLKKYIARKYSYLMGVLPIIKTALKFKLYYTITDTGYGVTHQGTAVTTVIDNHFHFTDVPDLFVQSAKGVIIENIPAMTYQGLYTLTIDRVEVYASVLDTKQHLVDGMNPYYSFIDNNTKIQLNHSTIESIEADNEILLAECVVNKSFDYHANITNRLRITFVSFMSTPIACGNTVSVWEAMNEPTEEIISQLRTELSAVEDEIKSLHEIIEQQNLVIQNLNGQIELNKNNIAALTDRVTTLESNGESYDARLDDHERRIQVLEAIPLATISYKAGREFVRAQLTWLHYGELYQVTRNFTASGNFDKDVADGYLVKLSDNAVDLTALTDKVNEVEATANSANDTAISARDTVEGFATRISANEEAIEANNSEIADINTDLAIIQTDINSLKETVPELDASVTEALSTIDEMTNSISSITERVGKNETDITSLNDITDGLTESVTTINTDITDIKDDITEIKGKLPDNP